MTALFALIFVMQEHRHSQETAAWRQERAQLLQRIQAPEKAVETFAANETPKLAVKAVGFDDDDDAAAAAEAHAIP